ncbi:MAG: ImmA/IrrE family metallo-endopeptidase [Candidatus Aminicenantes bacterium]|nr:ImmA/IrrE family metallo-endopeptidase [Candidatus Aminicenantes bacterium]
MLGRFGAKLRIQRENLGLTQEDLAQAVGLSSEFISLLELGKRQPSLESLKSIAAFLKKDPSYFLEEKEMAFDKLLNQKPLNPKVLKELKKFRKYCEDYLKLEEILGRRLELAPAYSHTQPERLAFEERCRIGLGDAPIRNIFSLAECNGLRVYRQAIDAEYKIAGIFIFFEIKEAAFALINSSLSLGEQIITVAHEYYHFLRDRFSDPIIDNPDVLVDDYVSLYHPREKFAHLFAKRLLMPPTKVRAVIEKDLRSGRLRYEDVIYLKRFFGVGTPAMLQTLRDLEYLSYSQVKEFENRDHGAYEKTLYGKSLVDEQVPKGKVIPSDRFKNLAVLVSRMQTD